MFINFKFEMNKWIYKKYQLFMPKIHKYLKQPVFDMVNCLYH